MGVTTVKGETNNQSGDHLQPNQAEGSEGTGISTQDVFEILSNNRRRRVLSHLRENGESSNIRNLSERLAAIENNVEPAEVNSKQRTRTYTALRQSHLPKMDKKGVIDFDENSGAVTLNESASQLECYLNVDPADEFRWRQYYFALGLVGVGLTLMVYSDIGILNMVPEILTGLIASIAIVLASLAHHWLSS